MGKKNRNAASKTLTKPPVLQTPGSSAVPPSDNNASVQQVPMMTSSQLPHQTVPTSTTPVQGLSVHPQQVGSQLISNVTLQGVQQIPGQNVGSPQQFGVMCLPVPVAVQLTGKEPIQKIHDDIMQLMQGIRNFSADGQVQHSELDSSLTNLYSKMLKDLNHIEDSSKADGCDMAKLLEEAKKLISDYIECISNIREQAGRSKMAFTHIDNIYKALNKYLTDLVNIYKDLELKIQRLSIASQQNETQMTEMQQNLLRQGGRVRELESEVNEYKSTVEEYKRKVEDSEIQKKELQSEVNNLETTVQTLTCTLQEQEKEVEKLKEQNKLSEVAEAKLVLRQFLTQVPTLMYRHIFPDHAPKRTYYYKDLKDKLEKMRNAAKREKDSQKKTDLENEHDKKKKELEDLEKKLGWDTDTDAEIQSLKESCQCNLEAHPDLKDKANLQDKIKVLEDNGDLGQDDIILCDKLANMWEMLLYL